MSYILITLCRNEEKNLPNLARSILAQTVRPLLWIIVDDMSSDSTPTVLSNLEMQNKWIRGLYLVERGEYMGFHYSKIFNKGFDFAAKWCSENDISYEYVALVDADNILEKKYFEKLIHEFSKNPKLGIASGTSVYTDIDSTLKELNIDDVMDGRLWDFSKQIKIQDSRDNVPMGSARIWSKKCFDETGGYFYTFSPDSVSNVKAKMLGWDAKRFSNAMVMERVGLIVQGEWQGYKKRGTADYYIWYPLFLAILRALKWSVVKPHYRGIAYLYGYFISFFCNTERLEDNDIKKYNQKIRPNEITIHYKAKFKKMLRS